MKENVSEVKERLSRIPRSLIAVSNTPLQHLSRLSARLNGPDIFIKRDDLTDLALGGNKARIMEYVMADAAAQGADVVIATAFTQSNLCRQTAAAARKMGMQAILVLKGAPGSQPRGNLLLDVMLGAELHFLDTKDDKLVYGYIDAIMDELRQAGRKPYFFNSHGDAAFLATFAYLGCFLEILDQSQELGINPSALVLASASGGTQSGLELGAALLCPGTRVIAVNPMDWSAGWIRARTLALLQRAAAGLGYSVQTAEEEITVLPDYVGEAYGKPTELSREAQRLFALDEAIILDPSYTAKAAGAMIDLVRKGLLVKGQAVIFVHSGGVPSLFAAEAAYDSGKMRVLSETQARKQVSQHS